MSDYQYLPASNGSGDAPLMHLTVNRTIGSTVYTVDSVVNVPTNFIATCGTLLSTGFIDPTTMVNFKGHVSGSTLIIDGFEPGSSDTGNTTGQVIVIKPTTGWANRVSTFINDATNTGIKDPNSNLWLALGYVTSAVNQATITNAITGTGPTIAATGSDTNIDFNLNTKGTGVLKVNGNPIGGAWKSYTPTVTLSGATLGNAVNAGSYIQIGKTVHFWARHTIGTTTSYAGLTSITVSLPVAASAAWLAGPVGDNTFQGYGNAGGNNCLITTLAATSTTVNVVYPSPTGTSGYLTLQNITATAPSGWNVGNTWLISGTYEAA
jgi:hypothetical protein